MPLSVLVVLLDVGSPVVGRFLPPANDGQTERADAGAGAGRGEPSIVH